MSQLQYQQSLEMEKFDSLKSSQGNKDDVMEETQQDVYRKAVGVLQWLAHNSKPHLGYYACYFACQTGKATNEDGRSLYRVLCKAKLDPTTIKFSNLGKSKDWKIITFTDSSFTHSTKKISIHGEITLLKGNDSVNLLDWAARKQDIPSLSSMSAEADAALHGHGKIKMVKFLLNEVLGLENIPSFLVVDNKSLKDAVHSTHTVQDKRTFVAVATLRKMEDLEGTKVLWTEAKNQLADVLTKSGANPHPLIDTMQSGKLMLTI